MAIGTRDESTKLTMHMNSLDVSQVIMWAFEKSLCTIRSSLANLRHLYFQLAGF